MYGRNVKEAVLREIRCSDDAVFLRSEFNDFGSYDQVGRVLRRLVDEGALIRAGYGVYVKAIKSSISGRPVPTLSLAEVGYRALKKLGVEANLDKMSERYNSGKSTQIPAKVAFKVKNRNIKRKIYLGNRSIEYERN